MKEIELKEDEILKCKIARIHFSTDLGWCLIYVKTSDSDIAHFYIENENFNIGICIFEPSYYDNQQNRLFSDIEKYELYSFLNQYENNLDWLSIPEDMNKNIWERIKESWSNCCNCYSNYKEESYIDSITIPDYNNLP